MGITITIEIYDEEDAINIVAAMKVINGIILDYEDSSSQGGSADYERL
jgi:hypothetical protein